LIIAVHGLDGRFKMLGHTGAVEVVKGLTSAGFAITDVTDDTMDMSVAMDAALGLPFGTTMNTWSAQAKTFGQDVNFASRAVLGLTLDFGAFIREGKHSTITITDLMNSLEMASRSLQGWRTNWQSMVDFQLQFVEAGYKTGMSSEAAAKAFGNLVNQITGLSDVNWLYILRNMEDVGVIGAGQGAAASKELGEIQNLYQKGLETYGTGPYGRVEAARSIMERLGTREGGPGATGSVWLAQITKAMRATGLEGGEQMKWMEQMGIDRNVSKVLIENAKAIDEWLANPTEGETPEKLDEAMKLWKEQGEKDAEDRLKMSEKIEKGISNWWRKVAPMIFASFMGITEILARGFQWMQDPLDPIKAAGLVQTTDWTMRRMGSVGAITAEAFGEMASLTKRGIVDMTGFLPPGMQEFYKGMEPGASLRPEDIEAVPSLIKGGGLVREAARKVPGGFLGPQFAIGSWLTKQVWQGVVAGGKILVNLELTPDTQRTAKRELEKADNKGAVTERK